MTCATCTHCEQRTFLLPHVLVRWCKLLDEPAIFVCERYSRDPGSDDAN